MQYEQQLHELREEYDQVPPIPPLTCWLTALIIDGVVEHFAAAVGAGIGSVSDPWSQDVRLPYWLLCKL